MVRRAVARARRVLCGGAPAAARGVSRTAISTSRRSSHQAAKDSFLMRNEVFGPVLAVTPFNDEAEALALANDTEFGLAAGVWTRDISRAHKMARALEAGTVWVNTYRALTFNSPFGGYKASGIGRQNGIEAIDAVSADQERLVRAWRRGPGPVRHEGMIDRGRPSRWSLGPGQRLAQGGKGHLRATRAEMSAARKRRNAARGRVVDRDGLTNSRHRSDQQVRLCEYLRRRGHSIGRPSRATRSVAFFPNPVGQTSERLAARDASHRMTCVSPTGDRASRVVAAANWTEPAPDSPASESAGQRRPARTPNREATKQPPGT